MNLSIILRVWVNCLDSPFNERVLVMLENGRCTVIDGLVSMLGKRRVIGAIACFCSFEEYCQFIESICNDFDIDYDETWPDPIDFLIDKIGEDAVLDGFVYGYTEMEFTLFVFSMYAILDTERN